MSPREWLAVSKRAATLCEAERGRDAYPINWNHLAIHCHRDDPRVSREMIGGGRGHSHRSRLAIRTSSLGSAEKATWKEYQYAR